MIMMRGKLINNAGHGNYLDESAVEKTIRYVTRTRANEDRADELVN